MNPVLHGFLIGTNSYSYNSNTILNSVATSGNYGSGKFPVWVDIIWLIFDTMIFIELCVYWIFSSCFGLEKKYPEISLFSIIDLDEISADTNILILLTLSTTPYLHMDILSGNLFSWMSLLLPPIDFCYFTFKV